MTGLESLHQGIILDHYRRPRHAGLREPFDAQVHHVNPPGYDEVTLRVRLSVAGSEPVLADVSYEAVGCAISVASVSVMTDMIISKTVGEATDISKAFLNLMQSRGNIDPDEDMLGDAIAFMGVSKYPARIECALLGWMAWKTATARALSQLDDTAPAASLASETMGMAAEPQHPVVSGHAFLSYVREDSAEVDRLQGALQDAGIPVWLDRSDLWPGEDWQAKIRGAITDNALVFIACFSTNGIARVRSYQNEELVLAIEQLRLRRPDVPWLIPIRFDDCRIPDWDIGGGRRLSSLQQVDLFGDAFDAGATRLVEGIRRILGPAGGSQDRAEPGSSENVRRARDQAASPMQAKDVPLPGAPGQSELADGRAFTRSWRYTSDGFDASPLMNMVNTAMPGYPGVQDHSPFVRVGVCVSCEPISQNASSSRIGSEFVRFLSGDPVAALASSLTHVGDEPWVRLAGHGAIRLEAALGATGETVKPVASAMLLPPVAGIRMHGRRDGVACLWLHFEPRGSDGSTAPPASLAAWHQRLRHAISLATRFTDFLVGELGLMTHDDPAARVGVMLNASPMTQLVDTGPLRPLPGAIPSHQFLGYAIADPAGQPCRDIARITLAQLCEYTLHLEGFEAVLAAL